MLLIVSDFIEIEMLFIQTLTFLASFVAAYGSSVLAMAIRPSTLAILTLLLKLSPPNSCFENRHYIWSVREAILHS